MVWLEGTLGVISPQPPYHGQGHLPPEQAGLSSCSNEMGPTFHGIQTPGAVKSNTASPRYDHDAGSV